MGCHTWFFRPIEEGEQAEDTCYYSTVEHGEDRYTDVDTPHDLFRINDTVCDEVYLLSLTQTLGFINTHNKFMTFSDNWSKRLVQFWVSNPDGVIEFG